MRTPVQLALFLANVLLATTVIAAPDTTDGWACQSMDGTVIFVHTQKEQAIAGCATRARAVKGGIYLVVPASTGSAAPAGRKPLVMKGAPCKSESCPAESRATGIQGSWFWSPPTRLENGDIHTDLSHFLMYRQSPGADPEVFAEISGDVATLIWGMDIRYANACFWIVAVRTRSAAMRSDSSDRICIDRNGQPLPEA